FQYKSPTCGGNDGTTYYSFPGSTFRSALLETDFALLELNQTPQANTGIRYAGWSRDATAATSSVGIHHPRGDVMKISVENHAATSVAFNLPGSAVLLPATKTKSW